MSEKRWKKEKIKKFKKVLTISLFLYYNDKAVRK